jgi:hypothetical protein
MLTFFAHNSEDSGICLGIGALQYLELCVEVAQNDPFDRYGSRGDGGRTENAGE